MSISSEEKLIPPHAIIREIPKTVPLWRINEHLREKHPEWSFSVEECEDNWRIMVTVGGIPDLLDDDILYLTKFADMASFYSAKIAEYQPENERPVRVTRGDRSIWCYVSGSVRALKQTLKIGDLVIVAFVDGKPTVMDSV